MADDPAIIEQIARIFETYAGDQRASIRKGWVKGASARSADVMACAYEGAAAEVRGLASAKNKAAYQVEVNSILDNFGISLTIRDELSLAIADKLFGKAI